MVSALDTQTWSEITETWTPNQYVEEFWSRVEAYALRKWGPWARRNPHITSVDDMLSIASHALIDATRLFPKWAEDKEMDTTSRPLFWAFVVRKINFSMLDYQRRILGRAAPIPQLLSRDALSTPLSKNIYATDEMLHPDIVEYEIENDVPHSTLTHDVVNTMAVAMPRNEQLVLALIHSESLNTAAAARLLEADPKKTRSTYNAALARVHAISRAHTDDAFDPGLVPDQTRLKHTEPADADAIIARALHAYRADPQYLVDMLDAFHGGAA